MLFATPFHAFSGAFVANTRSAEKQNRQALKHRTRNAGERRTRAQRSGVQRPAAARPAQHRDPPRRACRLTPVSRAAPR